MEKEFGVFKSNYKMMCFCCKKVIRRGDEITQCIETGGMQLRKKPYVGARWVHQYCLPKDLMTKYYMEILDECTKDFSEMDFDDICSMVDSLDYWTLEK